MLVYSIYTNVRCNRCKKLLTTEWAPDADELNRLMSDCDWLVCNDEHYCPDCYKESKNGIIEPKEPIPNYVVNIRKALRNIGLGDGTLRYVILRERVAVDLIDSIAKTLVRGNNQKPSVTAHDLTNNIKEVIITF